MIRHQRRSAAKTVSAKTVPPAQSVTSHLEPLESRRLMSTSGLPDYTSFLHTTGLAFNGYGSGVTDSHHSLQLTDPISDEARSAWYTTRVSIESFTTTFSFITSDTPTSADGFTFTIQNDGTTALGSDGHDLGYSGIKNSVGISFNLFNYGNFGSRFSFDAGGVQPASDVPMGDINLHGGDVFTCTLTYTGTTLTAKVVDDEHPTDVFTDSETIDIEKEIGAHSAYLGFTGSTGTWFATQKIDSWTYAYGPQITSLTASPTDVTKHVSTLTAIATDPIGNKDLIYAWNVVSAPPGARTVTFSNNESTADDTVVTVFTDGEYVFQCSVRDKLGFRVSDTIEIERT